MTDDAGFVALARKISAGVGLELGVYKDKCIRRRIAVRMRACGARTYADYGAMLDQTPGELDRLHDALTINVTRFYRNADTWNALRAGPIAALCANAPADIRVWSAGCSSGEEAYTLAMSFADAFDRAGRPERLVRLTVDATDIDRQSLDRAREGRYGPETLVETPPELTARYFTRLETRHEIDARLRRQVVVRAHDLTRDPPPRRDYHLIVCRNVVIYFDRPTQERLFLRFVDALRPGGYLVLGKVETLMGAVRERLTVIDARERVFQRAAEA